MLLIYMDTKLCNRLNNSFKLFERINDENVKDYNNETYKSALVDIYQSVYNTEQNYLNSECSQNINDYLKHGNVELDKYEIINNDAKILNYSEYKDTILNISSIILTIGFMFIMK